MLTAVCRTIHYEAFSVVRNAYGISAFSITDESEQIFCHRHVIAGA
jgi:hypothetical protein